MTISQRLNDAFTVAVEGLPAEASLVESEALEELAQGISPLTFEATLPLALRWLDLPMDKKPAIEYERFLKDSRLNVSDYTGFLYWLLACTGHQFYRELLRRQPELADTFRMQFLEITTTDYKRWSGVRGTCRGYAKFLAHEILEFVDQVLGEGARNEVIAHHSS